MEAAPKGILERLLENLEELTKIYAQLLDVVSSENKLLISANVPELDKNNESKELLIRKARFADEFRQKLAQDAALRLGLSPTEPRLRQIAEKVGGVYGLKLKAAQTALENLISKISVLNKENEELTQSALRNLQGALGNIKETISGKKTYGGKGQYKLGPETTGHFVRKEI